MRDSGGNLFKFERLVDFSKKEIVADLQRVADLLPDSVFTEAAFERHGRVGRATVRRRFGSWFKALEAAGLTHRSSRAVKTRGGHAASEMSDVELLNSLRKLAASLGTSELTKADVIENLPFSDAVLRTRWGTTRAAFEAAGLTPKKAGRRYTDEECFENLLVVWTHYGRPPTYKEMSFPPSNVGGKAYLKRFKTWNSVLAAFAERMNNESDPYIEPAPAEHASTAPIRPSSEERRDIPLGMRFKVLIRDRFKCVLCGDHPARNADCVLHVDHIMPWSRGGKTRQDNLRTLCAACNVGRGNRYTE
jgi:hypothetical protein